MEQPHASRSARLQSEHAGLSVSRQAVAADDSNLEALWTAHFNSRPPPGLGRVAFGSKWLHFVGYRDFAGPKPLIYDENIYVALGSCAGLDGLAPAKGRPLQSWLLWCQLAHEAARQTGGEISEADIEVELFAHAQACGNDGSCSLRREY